MNDLMLMSSHKDRRDRSVIMAIEIACPPIREPRMFHGRYYSTVATWMISWPSSWRTCRMVLR
jgi:hypothetical protein